MLKQSLLALSLLSFTAVATAQEAVDYEVTITNLTPGQTFTPQLVVTHTNGFRMFRLGEPASEGLEIMAEDGATGALAAEVGDATIDAVTIDGLLGPGQTISTTVTGIPGEWLSLGAMLIPTNDTFMALQRTRLPERGGISRLVPAYDAGTEVNDQNCNNIPGPRCGGEGLSEDGPDAAEGIVHISNGFHDLGDIAEDGGELLGPAVYDWRNPVARIRVQRIN
ncbi:MAG: spondin domain-containing protein [Pseudomonadota bacterium]